MPYYLRMISFRNGLAAVLAVLSVLWGLGAAISFAFTMIAMDTPIGGILFLALHVILLITLVAFAYFKIRASAPNNYWPLLLIGSIVFLALCLSPGSTMGSIMFPSAVGVLVVALLLPG
jgi:hypothetical protein